MIALTIVFTSTLIGFNVYAANGPTEQHCDTWSKRISSIDTTQESSFRSMAKTYVKVDPLLWDSYYHPTYYSTNFDLTITFSAEFLIYSKSESPDPLPLESIEVKIMIVEYDYGWYNFDVAKPKKVVMLTEEPDPSGSNWESRSFTFIYNNLPKWVGTPFKISVRWRLYPASSSQFEAQVRNRTLVVTVNPTGHE